MKSSKPVDWEDEFRRGRWDVPRWARVFLGVRVHPGQARMMNAYLRRTDSRWRALYFWIMVAAGNRAGKTMGLAIIILHSCVYRMGLKPPDPKDPDDIERWGKLPYHWWHFAVEQAPAEQVFNEIATMLGGVHRAQLAGCPWSKRVGGADKIATMTDTGATGSGDWLKGPKERGEYAWIKLAPDLGGAEIHFRSTKAKALSAIGQEMNGLSFDEAGLEGNLVYLLEEVMHARRLGTGGQFFIISTASAATSTDFEDLWDTGDPENPFQMNRRFSMSMSSRENVGYGLDDETFHALIDGQTENWIKQNIDGKFIQAATVWFNSDSVDAAFNDRLPEHQDPRKGGVYIQCLDPGLKDKTWSVVFEVRAGQRLVGVHIERMQGKQSTRGIVRLGKRIHHWYEQKRNAWSDPEGEGWIETGVDTTALGGHMFKELLEEDDPKNDPKFDPPYPGIPTKSVEFGGQSQVKRRMMSDARALLDEGRVEFPATGPWVEFRKQLRNYKLLDRKIEQDLVMELGIAGKLLRSAPPIDGQRSSTPLDYYRTSTDDTAGHDPNNINAKSIRRLMRESAQRKAAVAASTSREVH